LFAHALACSAGALALVIGTCASGSEVRWAIAAPIEQPAAALSLDVESRPDGRVSEAVSFTVTATNSGVAPLTGVTVSDPLLGATLHCDQPAPVTLLAGDSLVCAGTYVPTWDDLVATGFINEASASAADPDGTPVTAAAQRWVQVIGLTALTLRMTASTKTYTAPGEEIAFSFAVIATTEGLAYDVEITDQLAGVSALSCTPMQPRDLDHYERLDCTATYTVTAADVAAGQIVNTATAVCYYNHRELLQPGASPWWTVSDTVVLTAITAPAAPTDQLPATS